MAVTTTKDLAVRGIFGLSTELRTRILLDVLSTGLRSWVPSYAIRVDAFPLHEQDPLRLNTKYEGFGPDNPGYAPVRGILLSCKQLHHECLELLAERFTFTIHVNACDDAPTGANAFEHIYALNPNFRIRIKKIALLTSFLTNNPDGNFDSQPFHQRMNPELNPLLFEKIVENINEILHLMPAVNKVHLVWAMFFGNSGLASRKEKYTRKLWERLRKEWPERNVEWTAQHCMAFFANDDNYRAM